MRDIEAPPMTRWVHSASLANNLDTLSGVSGGAFAAAYFSVHSTSDLAARRGQVVKDLSRNVMDILSHDVAWTTPGLLSGSGFTKWFNLVPLVEGFLFDRTRWYGWDAMERRRLEIMREERSHRPQLFISATNLNQDRIFEFPADLQCLNIPPEKIQLSHAAIASGALPGLIQPVELSWSPAGQPSDLPECIGFSAGANTPTYLADGGVIDNLGLDALIRAISTERKQDQNIRYVIVVVNSELPSRFAHGAGKPSVSVIDILNQSMGGLVDGRTHLNLSLAKALLGNYGVDVVEVRLDRIRADEQSGLITAQEFDEISDAGLTGAYSEEAVQDIELRGYKYMRQAAAPLNAAAARLADLHLSASTLDAEAVLAPPKGGFYAWPAGWRHLADMDPANILAGSLDAGAREADSVATVKRLVAQLQTDLDAAQHDRDAARAELETTREQKAKTEAELATLHATVQAANENVSKVQQELAATQQSYSKAQTDLSKSQAEKDALARDYAVQREALEKKKTEAEDALKEAQSSLEVKSKVEDEMNHHAEDLLATIRSLSNQISATRSIQERASTAPSSPPPTNAPAAQQVKPVATKGGG
jgi:predicted acylesterase/phospholipase RssA